MNQAVTAIGGASAKHKRHDADFYATPEEATRVLLPHLPRSPIAVEPCCGDGAIAEVLRASTMFGTVYASDLHDRGYAPGGVDFRAYGAAALADAGAVVVTNPPFNLAREFIEHYCAPAKRPWVALLLKSTYWHAAKRADLFDRTAPALVMPMTWRPNMAPERGSSPTMDFAWTVWRPERADGCVYKLLHRPEKGVDR